MINPIPNGYVQFVDNKGNPLNNASVHYYHPGTTTPKTTWQDSGQTTANPDPIQLDSAGRAIVFGAGRYRQQVRAVNGSILFDGETSAGPGNLPLATGLSALHISDDIETLCTGGFSEAGKGAARYRRLSSAPSLNEQTAGIGRWLFRTNANTVWWRLAEVEPTDFMFGVLASATVGVSAGTTTITGPDDTAALQAALDYVLYFGDGCGKRLRMPAGMRRITNTVHLGYGDRYIDWQIDGDFATGYSEQTNFRAGLFADFNDRPLFNIQAARMARISGISLYGLNHAWLAALVPQMTDRTALASWWGPQLQSPTVNTRYAPYAAICVDGYSGTRQPESSYPDVSYPAWLGPQGQYSKGSSSNVEFKDISCNGFEVGFAVQPNAMPTASNGDFMHFTSCDFGQNCVGVSISHTDARVICFDRAKFHFCHTAFDSLTYGSRTGNIAAAFANCSFDGVYRALNVDLGISAQPFAPAVIFTNVYGEGMYTLGTVRSAQATGRPGAIRFIGGELGFFNRSGEYAPASYLDGRGEVAAYFDDVSIIGTHGVFPVDCDLIAFSAALPAVAYHVFEQTTLAGRRAAAALCGVHAPSTGTVSVRPYTFYGYDGGAQFGLRVNSHGWDFKGGGLMPSSAHVPLATRSIAFGGLAVPIAQAPTELLDRSQTPLSGLSQSGNEWSFSVAATFLSDIDAPNCCLGQGDIVRDEGSGVLFYVKSVAFAGSGAQTVANLVLRQITRVRSDNGTTWSTDFVMPADSGVLKFTCSRRILSGARRRLAMTTTEGSGSVALVAMGAETFSGTDLGPVVRTLAPGDFVLPSWRGAATVEDSVFAKARVTAVATSGGTPTGQITLDAPARRSGYWPAPLFIKGN